MQLCTRISIAHFVFLQLCTCSVHTYVVCIAVCICCAHLGMVFDKGALNHLQWTMDVCTGCDLLWACPIIHCREDEMPFSCVPWKAIFPLLSTLPPRWRATSLTLMMTATQPCTLQPILVSCPWWSTSSDPVDLMWRPLTRSASIVCCLSDVFCVLSGHTCCMGTVDVDTCTWVV